MNLRTLFAAVFLLLLLLSPAAWARKWSDRAGNSMVAKFVRIHEGKVVFLRAGKVVMVPFDDLVAEDQKFLRDDLDKKGQAHLLPPARPDRFSNGGDDESRDGSTDDDFRLPEVQRVWTDVDNRKITAALVRTKDDIVILLMNGNEVSVPMARLSRLDQNYVKARMMAEQMALAARNHGGSPAIREGGVPNAGGMTSRPPWAPSGPVARPAMPSPGATPGYGGPERPISGLGGPGMHDTESPSSIAEDESYEEEDEHGEEYDSSGEEPGSYDEQQDSNSYGNEAEQYASNIPSAHSPASPTSHAGGMPSSHFSPPSSRPPSFEPPTPGPPPSRPPAAVAPPMSSMPEYEEVGVCSNCNEEVSDEFGAGDHCPHCGVYFEYEEDEYGHKTEVAPDSGGSDVRITGRSIRGIVKLVIFGFAGVASLVGWVCRKMFTA